MIRTIRFTKLVLRETTGAQSLSGANRNGKLTVEMKLATRLRSPRQTEPRRVCRCAIDQLATIDVPASGTGPFTAEANPNLGLPLIGGFSGKIKNFRVGDQIIVDTTVAATFSQSGSVVSVLANGGTLGVLTFDTAANAAAAAGTLVDQVPCFAAGTRIATARGKGQGIRGSATPLGCRAHLRMAQPLPPPRQGLGKSHPQRARLPAPRLHPPHAQKTLQSLINFRD
jgi:hypothetical protein